MSTSGRKRSSVRAGGVLVLLTVGTAGAGSLGAQIQPIDLEASLRCFAEGSARSLALHETRRCPAGVVPVGTVVFHPETYGIEVVQDALDGLVNLAMSSEERRTQEAVYMVLQLWGFHKANGGPRVPGTIDRLEYLFFSGDPDLRHYAIPILPAQVDRQRAIDFMRRVAAEPDAPDRLWLFPAAHLAVQAIDDLGEEGRVVLQEMLASGEIAHPRARARARNLVERRRPR